MRQPVVLGISGSVSRPSRTAALVRHILDRIEKRGGVQSRLIELADAAPVLFAELTPAKLGSAAKAVIEAVEDADLLVAATPVYRRSYTGAFKHLFDLVDYRAFAGKPVIGTPEQIAERIIALKDAGAGLILLGFLHFQEEVDYFGKHVIPLVREREAVHRVPVAAA